MEEVITIKNIEVLLAGKSICSMGSKQSKVEAAYDYSRMNMIMGTDSNVSNSITYNEYMVNLSKIRQFFYSTLVGCFDMDTFSYLFFAFMPT